MGLTFILQDTQSCLLKINTVQTHEKEVHLSKIWCLQPQLDIVTDFQLSAHRGCYYKSNNEQRYSFHKLLHHQRHIHRLRAGAVVLIAQGQLLCSAAVEEVATISLSGFPQRDITVITNLTD